MDEVRNNKAPSLESDSPFDLRVELGRDVPDSDVHTALVTGDMGFLHSFTTGSTVDGPGVRVVAWTTGCQFRCVYCHNPDTWTLTNGIPVTIEKAKEQLSKYRHGLKIMSGGFTISGGEPLMQDRFSVKLLKAAKGMGIHTALDTNGSLGDRLTDAELDAVDLVLLDIKSYDPECHLRITGAEVEPVLHFARRLALRNKAIWIRFVLVPGYTDDEENVTGVARFVGTLGTVERVDVLPFHQMGRFKWTKLKLDYALNDVNPPAANTVERVRSQFRAYGLTTF